MSPTCEDEGDLSMTHPTTPHIMNHESKAQRWTNLLTSTKVNLLISLNTYDAIEGSSVKMKTHKATQVLPSIKTWADFFFFSQWYPAGITGRKTKTKKSSSRMNISFFKNSSNNGGKFISHGGVNAESLRCPAHTLQTWSQVVMSKWSFQRSASSSVLG